MGRLIIITNKIISVHSFIQINHKYNIKNQIMKKAKRKKITINVIISHYIHKTNKIGRKKDVIHAHNNHYNKKQIMVKRLKT